MHSAAVWTALAFECSEKRFSFIHSFSLEEESKNQGISRESFQQLNGKVMTPSRRLAGLWKSFHSCSLLVVSST